MKKLILITALLCCIGFVKAQESDATLDETLQWLKSKLDGQIIGKTYYSFSYDLNNKSITYTDDIRDEIGGGDIRTINLCDIINVDPEFCTSNQIRFKCNSNSVYRQLLFKEGTPENVNESEIYFFHSSMNTMSERIIKAFNHAIKLCKHSEKF
jgi:hypothetical protein